MASIIKAYKSNTKDNYINLGDKLSKQTSFIIKSCNMTGEAHDQLHVILVPILDEISIQKESNKLEESNTALNDLEKLIDTYYEYFKF